MLAVSDNHAEMETFSQRRGPLSLRLMGDRKMRTNSVFWCTDLGQVLDAALVRANPSQFEPVMSGGSEASNAPLGGWTGSWSLWTHESSTYKKYEFTSSAEAQYQFQAINCCAVLVGPAGKVREKVWETGAGMLGKLINVDMIMRDIHARVDQFLELQHAAIGLPAPEASSCSRSAPPQDVAYNPDVVSMGMSALSQGMGRFDEKVDNWLAATDGWFAKVAAGVTGGLAQAAPLQPSSRRRPKLHDRVRILVENEVGAHESPDRNGTKGRVGVIVEDDHSDQPYNVDLGDGNRDRWYKESWVVLLDDEPAREPRGVAQEGPPLDETPRGRVEIGSALGQRVDRGVA